MTSDVCRKVSIENAGLEGIITDLANLSLVNSSCL
jgi:hypothetical protein